MHYSHYIMTFDLFTAWAINIYASKTSLYMLLFFHLCTNLYIYIGVKLLGQRTCLDLNTKQFSEVVGFAKYFDNCFKVLNI